MKTLIKWLDARPAVRHILIPALAVLFGVEMIRYFVSGMTWVLGDRFAVGAFQLGGIAIVFFGMAFLAAPLGRLFGSRQSLAVAAVGLGTMRLHAVDEFAKCRAHRLRGVNVEAHAVDIGLVRDIR